VTLAFSVRLPPAVSATAMMRSALPRGVSRIATRTPSCAKLSGPSGKIFEYQIANEIQ
jgi:hypothetical protein